MTMKQQRLWLIGMVVVLGIVCLVLAPMATSCISWSDGRACETGWTVVLNAVGWLLLAAAARLSGIGWLRRPPRLRLEATDVARRTTELIDAVRDRLSEAEYAWASANSAQTEWEVALAVIHDAAREGRLVLTDAEAAELFAISEDVDPGMLNDLVRRSTGGLKDAR